jgi:DNA invertase Pin-like site-specific DNA recombinase
MMLIHTGRGTRVGDAEHGPRYQAAPPLAHEAALELSVTSMLEQTVRARYEAGHSQRAVARELNIDRREVRRILDQAA